MDKKENVIIQYWSALNNFYKYNVANPENGFNHKF